jgi:adenylate cyclase
MPDALELRFFENQEPVFVAECDGPISLGRCEKGEPDVRYAPRAIDGWTRIVIAHSSESTIPRAVILSPLEDGNVRLHNKSAKAQIAIHGEVPLEPHGERIVRLPVLLSFGSRAIRIQEPEASEEAIHHLPNATVAPGTRRFSTPIPPLAASAGTDTISILRWLQSVLDVVQGAASSDEFFSRAERAVVDSIGMDWSRVLLVDSNGNWTQEASNGKDIVPSRNLLDHVRHDRRTFWASPKTVKWGSVQPLRAVIAAPILNRAGDVIGALYGERRNQGGSVAETEAVLVELLANVVAAGLARMEQERSAVEAEVRFGQFFDPQLARHLSADPTILAGHPAEVTVLFADVRGYSRVAERLGADETAHWMREVLGALSACVHAEGGVLIDYVGDELMALWGAPAVQPDHAVRAVRAAQAMLRLVPRVGQRWHERVGEQLRIGVGAHSGPAWVGEVGTEHKFKYGPRGHTVNMASRVQGASKYLRVSGLITGATRAALDGAFPIRRLTSVRVVNIAAPVELFEIVADPPPEWTALRDGYEEALGAFETLDARAAARKIGNLLADHRGDGPSLLLLKRAVDVLVSGSEKYDPVWELPGK